MDERIDAILRRAAADGRVIGLAGGLPAEAQFPRRALARSFLRVLGQAGAPALQYGWAEGSEGLRDFIAARLRARGAAVETGDVIVTSGAQQALAIALELVCPPGGRVAVDAETYPAALELMRARRLVPVAAPPTERGVRAVYAMPAVGNPHGAPASAEARRALLAAKIPIIEDDAYADLRFAGPVPKPLLAEAPQRVLHVGTFSKTLCPGLRIGWLVAPPRLRRRALRLKQGGDLQASSLAQAIVEDYLTRENGGGQGHRGARRDVMAFEARLLRLRRFYRRRATLLASALRRHLPSWRFEPPEGGFAAWVETDGDVPEATFLSAAVEEGVAFDPASLFRPAANAAPGALRLCFSAAPADRLDEAVRRLARAWRRVRRARPRSRSRRRG